MIAFLCWATPLDSAKSKELPFAQSSLAVATPYDSGRAIARNRYVGLAAAGLYSTAGDLARFLAAGMRGSRGELPGRGVLTPTSVAVMQSPAPHSSSGYGFYYGFGYNLFPLGASLRPDTVLGDGAVVPGHMGQVWLGVIPNQLFTVSSASVEVRNNLELRTKDFGSTLSRGTTPGAREVLMNLELFSQDDEATTALYQAARQQLPVGVMFQLGQSAGQLVGIYLKSLVPDVPQFYDSDKRLKWKFRETRAQGTAEDEIVVAFG